MRKLQKMLAIWLLGTTTLAALTSTLPDATAARNPAKASIRCRRTIGQVVLQTTTAGLKTIERCHAQRDKGRSTGDCNSLAGNATFDRAKARAIARINVACKAGDPVLANYGNPASLSNVFRDSVLAGIQRELEESGTALQGSPTFGGDPKSQKALRKCHGALGKGRTGVVQGVLRSANTCQQRIDKRAQSFGPIDPSCLGGSGGAGNRASVKITKACKSFAGTDVGSCASLPGCLVTAGETTAHGVARLTYSLPVCGDGRVEGAETCDDGNTVDNDGCTSLCQLLPPRCGDGIVNQSTEECDEDDTAFGGFGDEPSENCFNCKLNVCGDGQVDLQEPGVEACDDGNDVPNDGCTNCTIDGAVCGAGGLAAVVALDYPEAFLSGVSATSLELSYPGSLTIPGSGTAASVRQRIASQLPSEFTFFPGDRDTNGDSVDDLVRVEVRAPITGSVQPAVPIARIQFDCSAGVAILPGAVPCSIDDLVDPSGLPFAPELKARAHCTVTLEGAGVPPTTTTSTTITTTSTTPVSTTTTTTPILCGNGTVDAGEECDDGNMNPDDGCSTFCTICGNNIVTAPESCDDGNPPAVDDNCPEDCRIELCEPTASTQTITIVSSRPDLTSIRFLLDYPDGRVALPGGVGPDVPTGTFTDAPGDVGPFDLEHAVRVVVSAPFTFDTTTIAHVNFLGCAGAASPSASDYRCIVIDASDENFTNVSGVTCSVTIP